MTDQPTTIEEKGQAPQIKKPGRKLGQKDTKPRKYKHLYRRKLRAALHLNPIEPNLKPIFGKVKLRKLVELKESGLPWKTICKKLKASPPYLIKRLREVRPDLINQRGYHSYMPIINRAEWPMVLKLREVDRMKLEEIAKIYGVSRERIRQILKIMKPGLRGSMVVYPTYTCVGCGTISNPDQSTERKRWAMINLPRLGRPTLCPADWPIFDRYKRVVGRLYIYHKDYGFINEGLGKNMKMYDIGAALRPDNPKHVASIKAHLIRKLYEDAQRLMVEMELNHPWIRGVYETWAADKTPSQINPHHKRQGACR